MSYCIESRGAQSNGVRVIDVPNRSNEVKTFPTRKEAREYADSIVPQMPSKNLPLVVVEIPNPVVETIWMVERADGSGYRRVSREVTLTPFYELEGADGDEEANTVTYWFRRHEEI